MSAEERLLKAIFEEDDEDKDDELSENYPETYSEKAHYAEYVLQKSLEHLSPALNRLSRFRGLLQAGQKEGKDGLPDIITYNESRMVLERLSKVKNSVDDAWNELCTIYKSTKGADGNV